MKRRVACLQMNSGPEVEENLEYIDQQLAVAADQGVVLVQLPENFAQMPATADSQVVEADGMGRIQTFLADAARTYELAIIAGALPIKMSDANPFARCLVFDSSGQRIAHYDKVHLFNVELPNGHQYREQDRFSPAVEARENIAVATVAGLQLGLSICYDLRFPEQYRLLSDAGAELLSVPSAFTYETGEAHWHTLLRARAIENLSYVFAAAQAGEHASGRCTYGHSVIISPWGEILAETEQQTGLISAEIDLTHLQEQRARFPALQHRRL